MLPISLEYMDAEADLAVQPGHGMQPRRALPAGFPVVRRHLEQGADVLLAREVDAV